MRPGRYLFFVIALLCAVLLNISHPKRINAEEKLSDFDEQVRKWATSCRNEVTEQLELLLSSGRLTIGQIFDTFYVPIPNTDPQKYHTQYDKYTDEVLLPILDKYLAKDKRIMFVVAVDVNGYLPTHNSKYSLPLINDYEADVSRNRTKRLFNDRTGLAAARSTDQFLLQRYSRDTGENMADLSVPIFIKEKHWGAVRFGYRID